MRLLINFKRLFKTYLLLNSNQLHVEIGAWLFLNLVEYKYVHSDDFNTISSLSGIAQEVISDCGLCASVKDCNDF